MSILLSFANSVGTFIQGGADDLQNFANDTQKSLNDRVTNAQNIALNKLTDGKGQNIFTPDSIANVSNLINKFKSSLDPRKVPSTPSIDGSSQTNADFFSNLDAGSNYNVLVQGDTLKGLIGSKDPVIPLILNIVSAPTATDQNIQPLMLFVTPRSWSRTVNKVQNNNYVRGGIKTERWGEEMDQITAEGDLAGFYTQDTGLTRFYRRLTPSYQNFMQLVQYYRNNGCSFGQTYPGSEVAPLSKSRILDVGHVEILYGFELFRGTFDSLTVREAADRPFTLTYTFVFNVSDSTSIHDILTQSTDQAAQQGNDVSQSGITLAPGQQLQPSTLSSPDNQTIALRGQNNQATPLPPSNAYGVLSLPDSVKQAIDLTDDVTGLTYRLKSAEDLASYNSLVSQINAQIVSAQNLPTDQRNASITALQQSLNQIRNTYLTTITSDK